MFQPDRLLVISERQRCGLILRNEYIATFAGPGAAIGSSLEAGYQQVIEIGTPQLLSVTSRSERQQAFSRRIQWIRWLQQMCSYPEATVRAEKLLAGFEAFFGQSTLATLSDDILAALIGVLPQTMALVRSQQSSQNNLQTLISLQNRPQGDVAMAPRSAWSQGIEPVSHSNGAAYPGQAHSLLFSA
ncbi:hypothetical protein BST81_17795 [Leptolyngbya sp. 'hensonii']|uniref:hypothetical protein n=1 Tax=Leptolyngbya sp. 'hensonii' TaxID=1922337 RepID=UPI00094FDBF4|nr:hypothetical protein [Leptolyngbya sp. 'hensonii']OLP17200.1 hypothetical protein BST81_17795 [Leptolyngbya sp. 'hensonii']